MFMEVSQYGKGCIKQYIYGAKCPTDKEYFKILLFNSFTTTSFK